MLKDQSTYSQNGYSIILGAVLTVDGVQLTMMTLSGNIPQTAWVFWVRCYVWPVSHSKHRRYLSTGIKALCKLHRLITRPCSFRIGTTISLEKIGLMEKSGKLKCEILHSPTVLDGTHSVRQRNGTFSRPIDMFIVCSDK